MLSQPDGDRQMPRLLLVPVLSLGFLASTVQADEVLETIDAARAAYEKGDIQDTMEELAFAQQLVRELKTAGLAAFLPEAPDGWTREINSEMGAAMAMFGGGVGSEATYASGADRFKVTLMADNAMVQAFAGMLANAGLMGLGKRVRIGSEKFMDQDGELTGLVDNRILVQSAGAPVETMTPILEAIDYEALAGFAR
jgi:hypothetical protein